MELEAASVTNLARQARKRRCRGHRHPCRPMACPHHRCRSHGHSPCVGASGKKICIRTHRQGPDAPGARNALDAPWQGTYRSQRESHRQCEFGRSMPWHHAFGHCMPGRRASRRSSPQHLLTGWSVSGHFPSGRSRVRAFSFWTQTCQSIFLLGALPCQGKWRPDDACHGTTVTQSVKVRNIVANTLVAFANTQRVPGIVSQSSSIHSI